jgi:hypothetical protein
MLNFSKHGRSRAAQRNIKDIDVELVFSLGSEVADGYLMRECDCLAAERELKREIQRIRRLRGKRLVVKNGVIVTVYHATARETTRVLRRSDERQLEYAA